MRKLLAFLSLAAALGGCSSGSNPDLTPYLTSSEAATTYLGKSDAAATYLARSDAAATYLPYTEAAATYATSVNVAATYLTQLDAVATFLAKGDAATTYLSKADAAAFLTQADASSTYLSQAAASSTYLSQAAASSTYLSQAGASSTYLTQAGAASTYQLPLSAPCQIGQVLRGFDQAGAPICTVADCPRGYADCDGNLANGCEADLLSASTCGTCGQACPGGQVCWPGGICTTSLVTGAQREMIDRWTGYAGPWLLCYRLSRDGSNPAILHAQCNNRGASFFVARLSTGKLVGGYTGLSWQGLGSYRTDGAAFLFSLSNGHRYGQMAPLGGGTYSAYAIYDNNGYGVAFGGGHDFYTNLTTGYANLGHSFGCRVGAYGSSTCQNDLAGTYSFNIAEFELYVQQ